MKEIYMADELKDFNINIISTYSKSFFLREMQIRATMRNHYTPIRITKTKDFD